MFVFIDTCTWWHWFSYLREPLKLPSNLMIESQAFQKLYSIVLSSRDMKFVFDQKVEDELPQKFVMEFKEKVIPFSQKVPIPLTRMDGSYKFDGSFMCGGTFGGSLRELLVVQGYPHADKLEDAARSLSSGMYLYETNPRKREFDIEHMEAALECGAGLFITTDERILKLLKQAVKSYPSQKTITRIYSITKSPSAALPVVESQLK